MNEAETRAKLIDPAIKASGWTEDQIRRELSLTAGRLFLVGETVHQEPPLRADYVLYDGSAPIAVVEAKDDSHPPASGLQQGKRYAEMLDVQFAFSSNGRAFTEFDFAASTESERAIDDFPSLDELRTRSSAAKAETPLSDPIRYPYNAAAGKYPRYYQDVAVRRAIAAIRTLHGNL